MARETRVHEARCFPCLFPIEGGGLQLTRERVDPQLIRGHVPRFPVSGPLLSCPCFLQRRVGLNASCVVLKRWSPRSRDKMRQRSEKRCVSGFPLGLPGFVTAFSKEMAIIQNWVGGVRILNCRPPGFDRNTTLAPRYKSPMSRHALEELLPQPTIFYRVVVVIAAYARFRNLLSCSANRKEASFPSSLVENSFLLRSGSNAA